MPQCGETRAESEMVGSLVVSDHLLHVCGLEDGHDESDDLVEQFHDCGICHKVGWHNEEPLQDPGSGQADAGPA